MRSHATLGIGDLQVRPLHEQFGAEVTGIDMRQPQSEETKQRLRELFAMYSILVFRDQRVTDEEQVAFTRIFGGLEETTFKIAQNHPYVYQLSNIDENGEVLELDSKKRLFLEVNARWHTDSSFREIPAKGSLLSGREVPEGEGETAFCSMRVGWQTLPEDMKHRVENLKAVHSYAYSLSLFDDTGAGVTGEELSTVPPVVHPVVRTHPDTGEKSLYVSGHIERIEGMPVKEGRALAEDLIRWCSRPGFVYEHHWQPFDAVMWDNRCALHRATAIPATQRRIMHRTTIAGEGPVV
ncbi:MAG: TauD/TfdA family dioxygenase [Parvibaculum sp.]